MQAIKLRSVLKTVTSWKLLAVAAVFLVLGLDYSSTRLGMDRTHVDVGVIGVGAVKTSTVLVSNFGFLPVRASAKYYSCSCSKVVPAEIMIPPFSKKSIPISTTGLRPGSLVSEILFSVQGIFTGSHRVVTVANVEEKFRISPSTLEFGEIDAFATSNRADLTIHAASESSREGGMVIVDTAPEIEAKLLKEGSQYRLTATICPRSSGPYSGAIHLKASDESEIAIRVSARVRGRIYSEPESIYLGSISRGNSVKARGSVKGAIEGEILSADVLANESPIVSARIVEGGTYEVSVFAEKGAGPFSGVLTLSSSGSRDSCAVPIFGYIPD